jgi:hypothetical protein
MRTGSQGYFLVVCSDATIGLHKLINNDPPSTATRMHTIWGAKDPKHMVVGLLAQGSDPVTLTVFIDGVAQEKVVDSGSALTSGHLALGGYAAGDSVDATITRYRAWAPAGGQG